MHGVVNSAVWQGKEAHGVVNSAVWQGKETHGVVNSAIWQGKETSLKRYEIQKFLSVILCTQYAILVNVL